MKTQQYVKLGQRVSLCKDFRNGAHQDEHKRWYPEGSHGVIVKKEGEMITLAMDNPPGITYQEKEIRVHRTWVQA
jgi:hypothetical protein